MICSEKKRADSAIKQIIKIIKRKRILFDRIDKLLLFNLLIGVIIDHTTSSI